MRIFKVALLGGAIGVAIVWVVAVIDWQRTGDWSVPPGAFVIAAMLGFLAGVYIEAMADGNRAYRLARRVPLGPSSIRREAVRFFAANGWQPTLNEPDLIVVTRRTGPEFGTAVVLGLLGIIPMLLYLAFSRSTQTATITLAPTPGGSDLEIVVKPKLNGGTKSAVRFYNSLHELPGARA